MEYIAFFEFLKGGKFDVTFPQFPGCVTQGDDFGDAQRNAAEALALHVQGMRDDGDPIPDGAIASRSLAGYIAELSREGIKNVIPVAIPLLPVSGRSVRIQVTIDENLLHQIDRFTKNRSAFLAAAAAERLSILRG